jgi:predicted AlkP superfamily phosphohydrolase/phosphomutase
MALMALTRPEFAGARAGRRRHGLNLWDAHCNLKTRRFFHEVTKSVHLSKGELMNSDANSPLRGDRKGRGKSIFVFGISGATWTQIDPLLQRGRLPAIKSLVDRGVRAQLLSIRVPGAKYFRPQIAWPTIATGVEPAKHGITRIFYTAADIAVPTIWERFQQSGRRVGLFGWPICWPVRPVNGFLIPAYDSHDSATWPSEYSFIRTLDRRAEAARSGRKILSNLPLVELFGMLKKLIRGGIRASTCVRLLGTVIDSYMLAPDELRALLQRQAKLDISVDIFIKLFHKHAPDFAALVTFIVDYTEHQFWMFQEPDKFADAPTEIAPRLASAVADSYVKVDRALGRILGQLDPQTIVAVLSEHGMEIEPISPEIGPWHWALRPGELKGFVGIESETPMVPVSDGWIVARPPNDQLATIADHFRSVRVAGTELPLFHIDVHRDEINVKLELRRENLPDPGELESLQVQYNDRTVPFTDIAQRSGRRRSAMHAENAVLILAGPGIRHADIGTARLIDIAPTLLKAASIDDSNGLDGQVLDVFCRAK